MALAAPRHRTVTNRTAWLVVAGLLAAALVVRAVDPQQVAWVRTYLVIFGSLLIQALPFVMLGALAAALVEVFMML